MANEEAFQYASLHCSAESADSRQRGTTAGGASLARPAARLHLLLLLRRLLPELRQVPVHQRLHQLPKLEVPAVGNGLDHQPPAALGLRGGAGREAAGSVGR